MNVSYKWLKDLVNIPCSLEEYCEKMVLSGFEIEGVSDFLGEIQNVVVARIDKIEQHPDADKLKVCSVSVGKEEPLQIVTAAPNVFEGAIIPLAMVNARLIDGTVIKKGKLRGVESFGMMCGGSEIGLDKLGIKNADVDGILILDEDNYTKDYNLGQDIISALELDDKILEFSITANRSDCMSVVGLAKESAAVLKSTHSVELLDHKREICEDELTVEVQEGELCPRYIGAVVDDVKIAPSPRWMQNRLILSGIKPINNIVDITNFVLLEYGQPMHAFDYNFINGGKIIVRKGKDNEKITTLDEKERTVNSDTLLICDQVKPIAVAGVMGALNSEIREDTKKVVFESAVFNSKSIRQTSKFLGLSTAASAKYSKGMSNMNPYYAINRALSLIEELGCGKVTKTYVDCVNCDLSPKEIKADYNKINERVALNLSPQEMKEILERLEIKTEINDNMLTCTLPYYRIDMERRADVSEEIVRIHGFDKVPSIPLTGVAKGRYNKNQFFILQLRKYLVAKGFNEAVTYSFMSNEALDKLNIPADDFRRKTVKILNPLGEDQGYMRTTMAHSILEALSLNYRHNNADVSLFEVGRVYLPVEGEKLPNERLKVAFGMYGEGVDFYTIKEVVVSLLESSGIRNCEITTVASEYLQKGRKCTLRIDGVGIAEIGEVAKDVREKYDIDVNVYYAVIDLINVYQKQNLVKKYTPIPTHPNVYRDLAVVVDTEVMAGKLQSDIMTNKYVVDTKVFDVYKGEQVAKGKKSVAISVVFNAKDRTLSEKEINAQFDKVVKSLKTNFDAVLRQS